jgi:sigma-B regulation protein RsbU (phosphoserine phosphatase)
MQGSTLRMSLLIDNVLDFARGRLGGGLGITLESGEPLRPALQQVIDEVRATVPERAIESRFDVDAPVTLDHVRIAQLLSNLLGNAITHGDPDRPVRIDASIRNGQLEISVANGGRPIPPEAMGHLFQPFYRGKVRPSQQGLGLGLFIAGEIAKAHGGRIDVASDEAETRFTFVMPVG